ncbi:MAG: hypothetical protein GY789_24190 [Hyphomicrobiales bacterium]|nr:hypothetical protein [Hyphomicrobiales bacterium]
MAEIRSWKPIFIALTVNKERTGLRGNEKSAQLKGLLRQQVTEARNRVLDNDGQISADEADRLERFARLVEITEQVEEPAQRPRWPVAAVLALTLGVVSSLLFLRVPSTNVVIDFKVGALGLVVPQSQILNEPTSLVKLDAEGLAHVRIPRSKGRSGQALSATDEIWSQLQLRAPKSALGRITLQPLAPPRGTRIWLRKTSLPNQFSLSLQHEEIKTVTSLTVSGRLGLRSPDGSNFDRDFGRGRALHLTGSGNVVDFLMTVADDGRELFSRIIPVSALTLMRVHQEVAGQTQVEESTIWSGTIYFNDLGEMSRALRAAESLRLEVSEGYIRTLTLAGDYFVFSFHGEVENLTVGEGSGQHSLMPTYLEWMSSQHALSLLWGAAMYVFGLALAVVRWWRIRV